MPGEAFNRLKARGAIEDNWRETLRLFEKLRATGRCPERIEDDDEFIEREPPQGVRFSLDSDEGKILIRDGGDIIGEWFSENKFFVLCMENHKRPFLKTPSVSVAYEQSTNLIKMPAADRKRFQSRLGRWMSGFGW